MMITARVSKSSSKQAISGVLLLNKPIGMSSNHVLQKVKHLFNAKKAGHTGSLDPLATGMLPICFGEATKFSQFLLDANKCYEVTGRLGMKTTTSDSEGEVMISVDPSGVSRDKLEGVIKQFIGPQKQVPSMYSALKHQGVPLYKLAREGKTVERKARDIVIYDIELLSFELPDFRCRVRCSKGTYIRNLIEDIGETLNVGAHVAQLHRLYSDPYQDNQMHDLAVLEEKEKREACLLPIESMLGEMPKVPLNSDEVRDLYLGRPIHRDNVHHATFTLYDENDAFIGVGELSPDHQIKSKRLLSRTDR